jgi:hypothetical protein
MSLEINGEPGRWVGMTFSGPWLPPAGDSRDPQRCLFHQPSGKICA